MKSCIEWRKGFKYLSEVDEFNINFREKEKQLLKFLDKYGVTQRVNLRIQERLTESQVDLIKSLEEKYKIAVLFSYYTEDNPFKDSGISYFFESLVTSWEDFNIFLQTGASEIYIGGDLGFDLERVKRKAKEKGIKIRAYLNYSSGSDFTSNGLKTFFIRPEDMDLYSGYIDVGEFKYITAPNQQDVLYDTYFISKEWNGDLQEIIINLQRKINSYYILGDHFALRRISCRRKCQKAERCDLCEVMVDFAESLEKSPDYEVFKRR